ncbi:MAG: hypothetical protein JXA69_16865 [Phycisphaerae bacterium]|nr:hypothetical protein [Phycisphaerae bacterium]
MAPMRRAVFSQRWYLCRWTLAGLLLVLAGGTAEADDGEVALLLTSSDAYEKVAASVQEHLVQAGHRCDVIKFRIGKADSSDAEAGSSDSRHETTDTSLEPDAAAARLRESKPRVVVAVGTAATSLAIDTVKDTPVVFCMVPNIEDRPFAADIPKQRLYGLAIDVDPREQLRWIKRLSPEVRTLGVPHSTRTEKTVEVIAQAARAEELAVHAITASREQFPAAIEALDKKGCDGVLMIADAEVYDSPTAQRLLLWGLRNRKPVWAFSPNVVKAGAFAAVYADPGATAQEISGVVLGLLTDATAATPGTRFPSRLLTAVNERTAEMIGIRLGKDVLLDIPVRFGQ